MYLNCNSGPRLYSFKYEPKLEFRNIEISLLTGFVRQRIFRIKHLNIFDFEQRSREWCLTKGCSKISNPFNSLPILSSPWQIKKINSCVTVGFVDVSSLSYRQGEFLQLVVKSSIFLLFLTYGFLDVLDDCLSVIHIAIVHLCNKISI